MGGSVLESTHHTLSELRAQVKSTPEKAKEEFRNYDAKPRGEIVELTYYQMHTRQTVDFVLNMREKWLKFDHAKLTIFEALESLNALVDDSDPDIDLPNSLHGYQTAESARAKFPDKPWLHLVGLIHDLGKVMALYGEPQWAVVGDTFPVGCKFEEDTNVFGQFFRDNPDTLDPVLSSKYGTYQPNCGLDNVLFSFGHDEYLYQVLKNHPTCTIPEEGLKMVRYHSFYPWHSKGGYRHLCSPDDALALQAVLEFNQFDLYSKSDSIPDVEKIRPYYEELARQYGLDGKIAF